MYKTSLLVSAVSMVALLGCKKQDKAPDRGDETAVASGSNTPNDPATKPTAPPPTTAPSNTPAAPPPTATEPASTLPAPVPAEPPIAVTPPTGNAVSMDELRKFQPPVPAAAPGATWKEIDPNEGHVQWNLNMKDIANASVVHLRDCRAGRFKDKSFCTTPYPLKYKELPARRGGDKGIHIRAGNINVHVAPGANPDSVKDETLLPLANSIDVVGLSKL